MNETEAIAMQDLEKRVKHLEKLIKDQYAFDKTVLRMLGKLGGFDDEQLLQFEYEDAGEPVSRPTE